MADLTLTDAQNGRHFAVHVGDAIDLRLAENASSGYRWSIASLDHGVLQLQSEDYHAATGAVGSGGTAAWMFRALKPGSVRLELVKKRTWEARKNTDEHFAVELTIAP